MQETSVSVLSASDILVSQFFLSLTLKLEAACSSEMPLGFQRATQYYIPEDITLHNCHCENLKSCILFGVFSVLNLETFGLKETGPFIETWQNFEDCIRNFEVSFIMIWNTILKPFSGGQRSHIKNFVTCSSELSSCLHNVVFFFR
jgi:hypothetical protein